MTNGDTTLAGVFAHLDANPGDVTVGKTRVFALLTALPGVGATRAAGLMQRASVAESRRVQGLTQRQRDRLVELTSSHPHGN